MSQTAWAQVFPGGVADAELQHALWRDRGGKLVALRLADGQLLWRSAQPLVPLLLGHGLALGLALSPPRVVALALAGAAAGAERWCSDALPWPEWALRLEAPSAAMDVQAGWLDDAALLRWHLRPAYTGGAAPGSARVKAAAAVGSCLLTLEAGQLRRAPPDAVGAGAASVAGAADAADAAGAADAADAAQAAPPTQAPSADPTVLARRVLGGVQYTLQQSPSPSAAGMVQTALVAHDPARGHLLWQVTLDDAPRKAPRALRS